MVLPTGLPRRAWAMRGAMAVMDQGLVSGTNFLLSILLARWLVPEDYGVYALCFSGLLLITSVHQALLVEPMSILGPVKYADQSRAYLGAVLRIHFALAIAMSAVLGVTAIVTSLLSSGSQMTAAVGGLGIAAPWILLFGLLRSACYVELRPHLSAQGALCYAILLFIALGISSKYSAISVFRVFLLMAGGSVLASGYLLFLLKPILRLKPDHATVGEVWTAHWRYGRWALGTGGVSWVWENSWYILTGAFLGLREVGGLRAIGNLLLPLAHTSAACGRLAQPYISALSERRGHNATRVPVWRSGMMFAGLALLYSFVIFLFSDEIFRLLYRGQFMEFRSLFPWLGVNYAVTILSYNGVAMGLRAIQSPSSVFKANLAGAVAAILLAIPAGKTYGLEGMIGASILANIFSLLLSVHFFNSKMKAALPAPVIAQRPLEGS